ncbi:hypothetical protein NUW58_g4423 [Xylaria curta]|uniref:Uncharacterized protein n=1 Tax=Xylaria curta TaxID=42375 RepID=A0ACC1P6K1_9PEZI|nr:hypothetical protein NUW58_g4423 [Xylaria curta]
MSVPNHSVIPITKDDIPTIGVFLQNSKLQLAINRFLFKDWPNSQAQRAHYTSVIEGALSNPQTTCLKVINDISKQPIAHLFYTRHTLSRAKQCQPTTEEKVEGMNIEVPAGFAPGVYRAVKKAAKELEPEFDNDEYIDLTHLYVDPGSRGQGIGSWLLRIAQEAAATAQLPFSVCVEPTHRGFFANRGFQDVKNVDIDLREWAAPLSGYGVFRISRMAPLE